MFILDQILIQNSIYFGNYNIWSKTASNKPKNGTKIKPNPPIKKKATVWQILRPVNYCSFFKAKLFYTS